MLGRKKILLDTNFLLIPAQFRVDIFSEIQRICPFASALCVLQPSVEELEKIAEKQRGKQRQAAQLAIQLMNNKMVTAIASSEAYVDQAIIDVVKQDPKEWVVATQDQKLKKELVKLGVAVITLRKKKYLMLIE